MTTAKERYEDFLKNYLTPLLKEKGFKKKGNKFILYGDELSYVLHVLRGNFNNNDYVDFNIYVSFHSKNFENKKDSSVFLPPLLSCGIDRITKNIEYLWVDIKTDDEDWEEKDRKMKEYFMTAIPDKIIPYMLQFKTIKDILNILENTSKDEYFWSTPQYGYQRFTWMILIYWFIGDKKNAIRILDQSVADTKQWQKVPEWQECYVKEMATLRERIMSGNFKIE